MFGFNVESEKNLDKELFENSLKCILIKYNREIGSNYMYDDSFKFVLKNNLTSRKLFIKMEVFYGSDYVVIDLLC